MRALWCVVLFGLLLPSPSSAEEKVTAGALRFTSSGPLFIAADRGYFAAEGLEVEIVFFEVAPPVAVAAASGQVTFGITALSAAFFNLAADGRLKIVAGQAREEKGFSGNLILVAKADYEGGADTLGELFGKPFGLTQLGSPSHYQLGQLAGLDGFPVEKLDIRTFQSLGNLAAALRGGAVSWAIIAPPVATDLVAAGAVVSLAPFSDFGAYQFGVLFTSAASVTGRPDTVRRFVRGYKRGLADYAALVREPGGEAARAAAAVVARYVYPGEAAEAAAQKVISSALYVDPEGKVDVEDVARQIDWYFANGMLKTAPDPASVLRLDFLD